VPVFSALLVPLANPTFEIKAYYNTLFSPPDIVNLWFAQQKNRNPKARLKGQMSLDCPKTVRKLFPTNPISAQQRKVISFVLVGVSSIGLEWVGV